MATAQPNPSHHGPWSRHTQRLQRSTAGRRSVGKGIQQRLRQRLGEVLVVLQVVLQVVLEAAGCWLLIVL